LRGDRLRRLARRRTDAGTTLIEMVVVMGLLSVILGIVLSVLVSMQNAENRVNGRSQTNDQVKLAVQDIDRQVRSGNVPYNPATEGTNAGSGIPTGFSMRVYTQANGTQKCVQWRVTGGKLQSRGWTTSWRIDNQVSGWRTVADHIVNSSSTPPFVLDTSPNFGGTTNPRLINIDVIANVNSNAGSNVEGKASITGRNFQYGGDPAVCSDIPTP
jgi:type II secretory pathway component PulJ